MVSIIRNVQEKLSPQQWNFTTVHISAYNIFLISPSIKIINLFISIYSYLPLDAIIVQFGP